MEEYQETNEISLIDLMFYCLKRWRWIFVSMIFLAVIAGVYKHQVTIADNELKKEMQLQQSRQSVTEQVEGEAEGESEPIVFENPVSSAVLFGVIGMFGGACLVCLFFCMKYIMSGKLQSERDFQEKFGMPLLGVIRKKESKKKIFRFIDQWICRLEEGPCAKIPRQEQIRIAVANVRATIHRESEKKIKKVMVAGTIDGDDVVEIYEQLVEEMGNDIFSPYMQIVFYAEALKKIEYYEGILFIEKRGESYEKLIRQEKKLAICRDIRVLGTIVC